MTPEPFRPLPETVEVNGRTVPVETNFRMGIAVEQELLTREEPDLAGLLARFYPDGVPADLPAALEAMTAFWRGADETAETPKAAPAGKGGRWYDFAQDADVLLSSFLTCYGLDLSTVRLHWWTFRRLMLNLPADSPFMQRVHYRVADLSKLGKEERKRYRKLKELYRVREPIRRRTGARGGAEEMRQRTLKRYEEARRHAEEQGP